MSSFKIKKMKIILSVQRILFFKILPITALFMFVIVSCNKKEPTLECVSSHIRKNISKNQIDSFTQLNGVEVWREWDKFTKPIAEDHYSGIECGIGAYLYKYNLSLDSLNGRVFFIYAVHSYLKNNCVDYESVKKNVTILQDDLRN